MTDSNNAPVFLPDQVSKEEENDVRVITEEIPFDDEFSRFFFSPCCCCCCPATVVLYFFYGIDTQQEDAASTIDLDDLFNDIYYMDLPHATAAEPAALLPPERDFPSPTPVVAAVAPTSTEAVHPDKKRSADEANLNKLGPVAELTEQQKIERRERNREHAKRSRLRKKFLLESLQDQIHGLEEQLEGLKNEIKRELPDKAEHIIGKVCGDKEKYTPLPMPSGFGPVKTLMEPDFRLMSALSGSQQNFAISDPSLPDNPIVYVSQGFLDLTGYTLDQVLGRNCRFLQGPGTDQSAVEVIRKGIKEGVDTSVCLLNYKADGTPFWNQFFVAALRDAENNVVNYVGVQCEVSRAVVEKHMGEQKAT